MYDQTSTDSKIKKIVVKIQLKKKNMFVSDFECIILNDSLIFLRVKLCQIIVFVL